MKNLVLGFMFFVILIGFNSCTKNYYFDAENQPQPTAPIVEKKGPVETDNPSFVPVEQRMYVNKLYIKKTALDSTAYLGNYRIVENNYYNDQNYQTVVYKDYYIMSAPKYWGIRDGKEYTSLSKSDYIISAQFLAELKKMIVTRGTIIVFFYYNQDIGLYEINSWTEQ